ncbi:MAG TPA: rod shape-determining protein MreC [Firmicutes bacterium]|nr:rod shape-determining protein MreC [Candidatus Fermentithermobacillaceae bacterium]
MRRRFQYKKIIVLAVLVAASVTLMNVTGKPQDGPSFWGSLFLKASKPVSSAYSAIVGRFESLRVAFADKEALIRKNEELEAALGQLRVLESRLQEVEAENERLRDLLGFQENAPGDYLVAEVYGRDPSKWFSSISIAAGTEQGVVPDAAVVCQAGLVGRVLSVGTNVSTVLLLTDPESGVGAVVQRSRDLGVVLGGGGQDSLTARFFSKDADVQVGDLIITSGMGSKFPEGLLIGEVVSVRIPQPGLVKEAIVRPSVDFEHLEEVMVVGR